MINSYKETNFCVNVQACGERKWTSGPNGEHDGRGTGRVPVRSGGPKQGERDRLGHTYGHGRLLEFKTPHDRYCLL